MNRLANLFRRRPQVPQFSAPLAPAEPLAVIGDLHGCDDLLERLITEIAATAPDARRVFVGDFVDRGENSKAVLERLMGIGRSDTTAVFLKGNHEEMMLKFLDDPERYAGRWLRYGGLQTLASFGVGIGAASTQPTGDEARWIRDDLKKALDPEMEAWLRGLALSFRSGNVTVVHAGADPTCPIEEQKDRTLIWGHPEFETRPRADQVWVVHGHTIQDVVEPMAGRIGTDTGAYATGRLSAALIRENDCQTITVRR